MTLLENLTQIVAIDQPESDMVEQLIAAITDSGYTIVEIPEKPWGATIRMHPDDADRFIAEFFPGVSPAELRLGNPDLEVSPKFMLWRPGARISWQYHQRRAESWRFVTAGGYIQSDSDEQGDVIPAHAGDMVSFGLGTRHRGVANPVAYTLVAEVWQHADPERPSDEDDIVRLHDEYARI